VTGPEQHAATVRENVSHIARGCRAGTSHNPAVYEQAIDAALDELVALAGRAAPEGREGIVTAYDHKGQYVGCIGSETWALLLARPGLIELAGRAEAEWRDANAAIDDLLREKEAAEARADELQRERDAALRQGGMTLDSLSVMVDKRDAAVASAEQARREADQLRAALRTIQEWDCLNPPQADLCADLPWLKQLVDAALAGVQADKPASPPPSDPNLVRVLRDGVQADNKDSA